MQQPAHQIARLCVYCGSSDGSDPRYGEAARKLGAGLAARGIALVYGGGRNGLMGAVADAVLEGGGQVTGIIPVHLQHREVAHPGLTELLVVTDMHHRKRVMAERADAFAVLPGGVGTLDETIEYLSWRQLGLHEKPIFIIDIAGYWSPLAALLEHIVTSRFAAPLVPALISFVPDVAALFAALERKTAETHEAGQRPDISTKPVDKVVGKRRARARGPSKSSGNTRLPI